MLVKTTRHHCFSLFCVKKLETNSDFCFWTNEYSGLVLEIRNSEHENILNFSWKENKTKNNVCRSKINKNSQKVGDRDLWRSWESLKTVKTGFITLKMRHAHSYYTIVSKLYSLCKSKLGQHFCSWQLFSSYSRFWDISV